jgi:eukaryotic-like serine/threonine-protein kinase
VDANGAGSWRFREGDEIVPGRYVDRLLGGGHRYEAYVAWDDEFHALVVAKLVRPALVHDQVARSGLAREARALERLGHPSIVRSFGAVLDGERPHLLLEYLDGPRLSTLARKYGVIVEQLIPLALDLCSALHFAHGRRMVHLDVKPRNVVMCSRPRLIDLSVARSFDELAEITQPIGTDAYMAPEQCDPDRFPDVGPASDVWGLGVTLFHAFTRTLPFPRGTDGDRYPQLSLDPAPLPKDTPPRLRETIGACLERRPADRPTALELAAAIEPLAAELPRPRLGLFRPGGRAELARR